MPIVNLKKFYYPLIKKDTFVEVSDDVAEALLELRRSENRIDRKIRYHKAYYSLDYDNGIENAAIGWAQPSPEDILMQKEDDACHALTVMRLEEAMSILTPAQARRIRARYFERKKLREIAETEGTSAGQISRSISGAIKKLRKFFRQNNWELWEG